MPCSIPPSLLAEFIAAQLAKLQAKIMAKVQEKVSEIQQKLLGDFCPPVDEIKRLLAQRDNLLNAINQLEKKITPIQEFAVKLDPPIQTAKVIIAILEQMPVPTTIGLPPGPSGGVIYSIPVGKQNRFAQLLNIACRIVENLEADKNAITVLTSLALGGLNPLKEKLMSIDVALFECVDKLPEDQKADVVGSIEFLPSNAGLSNEVQNSTGDPNTFTYLKPKSINPNAKGGGRTGGLGGGTLYTIKIVEDPNSPPVAKKRYAIVLNENGVTVLRGPSSFSSSTKVLVDEIKFRINNQLP